MCRPIVRSNGNVVGVSLCILAVTIGGLLPQDVNARPAAGVTARQPRDRDPRRSHDGTTAERRALDAAKALIRERVRCPVVLIDPELAPDPDAIRRVDAFIVTEENGRLRQKIYVNRESALFQRAADGDDFSVKVLAAVLVHEMAHLAGRKEPEARIAEQRFFGDLIANGVISEGDGLRYLAHLRQRSIEPPGRSAQ